MRNEPIIKSRSLAGSSDLTLLAPIKRGLVPSLESVSYKTRVKSLLQALNAGRSSSQEYALLRPISDAVERVGKIHSVRVTVLEPEDKVLLAATFDGTWEAYLRVLWQKVGSLLDIIFCDTEGYVTACDHRYEEWVLWAQRVQVETDFFYGVPYHTVDDTYALRAQEALLRTGPCNAATAVQATRSRVHSAQELAWQAAAKTSGQASLETFKQGVESVAALYRLTDLYVPSLPDGRLLQRAARDLLLEFRELLGKNAIPTAMLQLARLRFDKQLDWLLAPPAPPDNPQRVAPPLPQSHPEFDRADVQGGIVASFDGVTHGALLLLAIADRSRALDFVTRLIGVVRREDAPPLQPGELAVNLALSYEGLRACGLVEAELDLFPPEFRQGMAARASVLGDVRGNHPRRWRLPRRYDDASLGVELGAVHLVLQLRMVAKKNDAWRALDEEGHPLHDAFVDWSDDAKNHGLSLLSVQAMQRWYAGPDSDTVVEHFGWADGDSDPVIDPAQAGRVYSNQVHLGELLLGYDNAADFAPDPEHSANPETERRRLLWLRNGSFLVVRKLAQDVAALDHAVCTAHRATGLPDSLIRAKLMGRETDGRPLAGNPASMAAGDLNDFDYSNDRDGRRCPLHAHIRRANPRAGLPLVNEPPGARPPRIARRGMSYGPRYVRDACPPTPETEKPRVGSKDESVRGLVFMAYNASIGEQFEVIQRWISGGNSSGGYSGQSDPLLGVPENGQRRVFRFEHDPVDGTPEAVSIALDGSDEPLGDRQPFVRLEWGAYFFTPSISALRLIQGRLAQHAAPPEAAWSADKGARHILDLQALQAHSGDAVALQAWKAALEDPDAQVRYRAASIWAAIRERHAGVLRTPYGVLVAEHSLVMQAFGDTALYSVRGYHERLGRSIGDIYLGHDPGPVYDELSAATNAAIEAIGEEPAYVLAHELTRDALAGFLERAQQAPNPAQPDRWELTLDLQELSDRVLGELCRWWFGLPEETPDIKLEGSRWNVAPQQALYPGHFTAPSRYVFQPQPGVTAVDLGCEYGRIVTSAFTRFVQATAPGTAWTRCTPDGTPAPLGEAIWTAFGGASGDPALIARTLVGTMMGLLPTLAGNLGRSLNEWLLDGSFWSLRACWAALKQNERTHAQARRTLWPPLRQAMQLRPAPELVWRTATRDHRLGPVAVQAGDVVVLAIVSATQQSLVSGDPGVCPVFGGRRDMDPHPAHACPGYAAAMGTLLGFIAALLEVQDSMRAAAVPLALVFEGEFKIPVPTEAQLAQAQVQQAQQAAAHREQLQQLLAQSDPKRQPARPAAAEPPGTPPLVIGLGDSWFHYFALDLFEVFNDQGLFEAISLAREGTRLQELRDDPAQLLALASLLRELTRQGRRPQAILVSAGGNDIVTPTLAGLLHHGPDGAVLDEAAVEQFFDAPERGLRGALAAVLGHIDRICLQQLGSTLPIVLHGYDGPHPDGRGLVGTAWEAWLRPDFVLQGWTALEPCTAAMRTLIGRLHQMQDAVAAQDEFRSHVRAFSLVGTLHASPYTLDWGNELHPTPEGFVSLAVALADKVRRAIVELGQPGAGHAT